MSSIKNWPADKVERKPIEQLIPYANNARTHSDEQISQIAASMNEWGWTNPVLVDEGGMIIAGHGRVLAARKLGFEDAPVMTATGWTEAQKKAYVLADNQLTLNAGWDNDILATELQGLGELDFNLDLLGFDAGTLAGLLEPNPGLTDPDDVPEVEETAITQDGDLWILGNHRLVCGDSTKSEDVEKLSDGVAADLCFTSPPYAQQRDYKQKIVDWDAMMAGVFTILPVKDGANVLVNLGLVHDSGRVVEYWDGWIAVMDNAGWPLFGWYVWDQGHGMPGNWNGRLAPSHEFVFHFCKRPSQANKWVDKKPENIAVKQPAGGAFRQVDGTLKPIYSGHAYAQPTKIADSVIRVNRAPNESAGTGHPAMFPVALCDYIYNSFIKSGDVVYEPFAGAGTSVIACEQFGASCLAMELAPEYCDVTIKRWQDFTGKDAKREDGKTFNELSDE